MTKPASLLVALVALIHVAILLAEMFAWDKMGGRLLRTEDMGLLDATRAMAFNQGLYNGFLAAGLIWSLTIADAVWQRHVATFFLLCVAVAGIVGALTVSPMIISVQTVPAALALALVRKRSLSS